MRHAATWAALKSLRNAGIGKYLPFASLGIPIFSAVAPIVLKSDSFRLLSSWGYLFTYLSTVVYIFSCSLFDHICPDVIKDNKDRFSYFETWANHWERLSQHKTKSEERIHSLIQTALGDRSPQPEDNAIAANDAIYVEKLSGLYDDIESEILSSEQVKNLDGFWDSFNKSKEISRLLLHLLFVLSLLTAFYVVFVDVPVNIRANLYVIDQESSRHQEGSEKRASKIQRSAKPPPPSAVRSGQTIQRSH